MGGANSSLDSCIPSQYSNDFQVLKYDQQNQQMHLRQKSTGQLLIGTAIIVSSRSQQDKIQSLVDIKRSYPSPFVEPIQRMEKFKKESFFSQQINFIILFKRPETTLADQIKERSTHRIPFSDQELIAILENCVRGLQFLHKHNTFHGSINTANIIIDQSRQARISDPWMIMKDSQMKIAYAIDYPSPQKVRSMKQTFGRFGTHESDLFSLGMVVLEAANLGSFAQSYKSPGATNPQIIKEYVSSIQDAKLRTEIDILTSFDPKRRNQIYSIVQNRNNSESRKQLQRFRKSIIGNLQSNKVITTATLPAPNESLMEHRQPEKEYPRQSHAHHHHTHNRSNFNNNQPQRQLQYRETYTQPHRQAYRQPYQEPQRQPYRQSERRHQQVRNISHQPTYPPINFVDQKTKYQHTSFQEKRHEHPYIQLQTQFQPPTFNFQRPKQPQQVNFNLNLTRNQQIPAGHYQHHNDRLSREPTQHSQRTNVHFRHLSTAELNPHRNYALLQNKSYQQTFKNTFSDKAYIPHSPQYQRPPNQTKLPIINFKSNPHQLGTIPRSYSQGKINQQLIMNQQTPQFNYEFNNKATRDSWLLRQNQLADNSYRSFSSGNKFSHELNKLNNFQNVLTTSFSLPKYEVNNTKYHIKHTEKDVVYTSEQFLKQMRSPLGNALFKPFPVSSTSYHVNLDALKTNQVTSTQISRVNQNNPSQHTSSPIQNPSPHRKASDKQQESTEKRMGKIKSPQVQSQQKYIVKQDNQQQKANNSKKQTEKKPEVVKKQQVQSVQKKSLEEKDVKGKNKEMSKQEKSQVIKKQEEQLIRRDEAQQNQRIEFQAKFQQTLLEISRIQQSISKRLAQSNETNKEQVKQQEPITSPKLAEIAKMTTEVIEEPISETAISSVRDRVENFNLVEPLPTPREPDNNNGNPYTGNSYRTRVSVTDNVLESEPLSQIIEEQGQGREESNSEEGAYEEDQQLPQERREKKQVSNSDNNSFASRNDNRNNNRNPVCPPSSNSPQQSQKRQQGASGIGQESEEEEQEYVIEEYEVGSRYEGQKRNNMRNGWGKFHYQEGSLYDGQWKDNKMHGYGKLYYANGQLAYEGDWYQDEFHGQGKVYNDNPAILEQPFDYADFNTLEEQWVFYEGGLVSDVKQGLGKIKLQNDQIFIGNFYNDKLNGEGRFYCSDGSVVHGIWRDSILLQTIQ